MVAYKKKVSDCEKAEALIHDKLKHHRITQRRYDRSREFFVFPLEKAISVVNEIASQFEPDIPNIEKIEKQKDDGINKEKAKVEDKKTPIKLTPEEINKKIEELCKNMPNGHQTINYVDGSKYRGECKHALPDGQGVWVRPNGMTYVGEWKDGSYHGQGIHISPDGTTKYECGWKEGKFHGQGKATYHSGCTYVGEFKEGKYHGQGTFTFPDGTTKYECGWKEGKFHGQGKATYHDGSKYVGGWVEGKRHGTGTRTYSDGSKYVGEFKNGERHGWGTYTYPTGKKIVREWSPHVKREVDKKTKKVLDKSFTGGLFSRKARQRARELRKAWGLPPYPYSVPKDIDPKIQKYIESWTLNKT